VKSTIFFGLTILVLAPVAVFGGEFPTGKFVKKMGEMQFALRFDPDGAYAVEMNDQVMVGGTFEVSNDTLTVNDKSGDRACPGPGKYAWNYKDKELSFTLVSDECNGRSQAMSSGSWLMKE